MQVRRGADRAEIYSLAFSSTIQWLAVSSDKGTVHVFSLKPSQGIIDKGKAITESSDQNHNNNTTPVSSSSSSLSFIKGRVSLFSKEIMKQGFFWGPYKYEIKTNVYFRSVA